MELTLRRVADDVLVPDDADYIILVEDILQHPSFRQMKEYIQHGATTCLAHCIAVSYLSYCTCRDYDLDYRSAARAGLLHDFFLYDWHEPRQDDNSILPHGFTHPRAALENAEREFELNGVEREIILRHMWPLTPVPPKSAEAYVVIYHDKVCSFRETMGRPHF